MSTSRAESVWAEGLGIFAGAALLTVGIFQFDLTTWGWIHIVVGIVVALIGGAILLGKRWALVAGIVLAVVSALMNFLWLPFYPAWAIVIIAFDMAVVWALSTMLGRPRA